MLFCGVQDILILCSDGLTGIKDAISTAFPKTEQQRCIVHMVRNTLKYVANKDMKAFAKELKTIYTKNRRDSLIRESRLFFMLFFYSTVFISFYFLIIQSVFYVAMRQYYFSVA